MKAFIRTLQVLLLCLLATPLFAGDAIQTAQKKLKNLGLYDGSVDGSMGSQTSAAIRRYQVNNKLKITGELTPETLRSLGIVESSAKSR
ncbi:MAG: peptidoglycan-binding domain-containing protein [Chthoniobacterales bacterium]